MAVRTGQFRRDVQRLGKRGKDLSKLRALLERLLAEQTLPKSYKDHPLRGEWKDFRDCHVEPYWLLIYRIDGGVLQLARTSSHADLFGS